MYKNSTLTRVRYAETDQMKIVYYGNYPQYFEIGRVEALRELGATYRELEEMGIMMPVLHLAAQYIRPARYDDLLTIHTSIKEIPKSRITFEHEIYNEEGILLTTGEVQLAFVQSDSGKPTRCPESLLKTLEPFFKGG